MEYGVRTTNSFNIFVDEGGYIIDNGEVSTVCEDENKCVRYVFGMVRDWLGSIKQ
jgi:hypothetical protein